MDRRLAHNVHFIAAEGFNVARVSMAYASVEPQLGRFDHSYIGRYLAFDRELAGVGVYDLIDMMQGEYSAVVGGGGFPAWMAITNGEPDNRDPFARRYLDNPAEQAVWNNFWADSPALDGIGLQDHYARGLGRLARAFRRAPGLLGLEILNEPWPGSQWVTCLGPAGCPPGGFDQTSLTSFYRRVMPALRSEDPDHLIAYEPNLLFDFGSPTRVGVLRDQKLLFAFHDYCLASAPGLPPNPGASASYASSENAVLANATRRARDGGGALLMDEWGNGTDLDQVERTTAAADRGMVGWVVWAYEDCCNSPAAIIKDGTKAPTVACNLNLPELDMLVRPYPELIAGTPTSWSYDPKRDAFSLTYTERPAAGGRFGAGVDTEVELPALRYPTGYTVRVRGARVLSAPDANLLRLAGRPGASTVQLTVTPARHHPAAPGPFRWPATATNAPPADCPARTRGVVDVRYRARRLRIVRVHVSIHSRPVAAVRGRRIVRIELPVGLADGSIIQFVASTAQGRRLITTRRLHGCSPHPAGAWIIDN